MKSVDITHGLSGHCPWSQWTLPIDYSGHGNQWIINANGLSGQCPQTTVDITHGLHLTLLMDYSVYCPWIYSEHCPVTSGGMDSVDTAYGLWLILSMVIVDMAHRQQWTLPTESEGISHWSTVDIAFGLSGHCLWTQWTLPMDSVDITHIHFRPVIIVRHEYGIFSMDLEVGYKVFFLMNSCR